MRIFAILLCVFGLAGCGISEALEARIDARDDAYCKQIGAQPGTQLYYDCRLERTRLRATIQASAASQAAVSQPAPTPALAPNPFSTSTVIQPNGHILTCQNYTNGAGTQSTCQ